GCRRAPHSFPTRRSSDLAQELIDSVAGMGHGGWCQCWQYGADDDRCECGLTTAKKEAKALKAALAATQQQGQAVAWEYLGTSSRSEEHTSELQSRENLVC